MSDPVLLLLLRLLSATLMLSFLGVITWLIYRDLQVTSQLLAQRSQTRGILRVIASANGGLPPGLTIPLQPVTSIGRSPHNTIVLTAPYASAEHALITWRGGQWWLEDLGSRNGTLLNAVPVQESTIITAGDVIAIGETQLKLEV